MLKRNEKAIAIIIIMIGMFFYPFFMQSPELFYGYLSCDAIFYAFLILNGRIKFFGLLFLVASIFYSHTFILESLLLNLDYGSIHFAITLSNMGVQISEYMPLYVICSIIFRNAFFISYREKTFILEKNSDGNIFTKNKLFPYLASAVILYALADLTNISLIRLASVFVSLALWSIVNIQIANRYRLEFFGTVLLIALNFTILLALTRSRGPLVNIVIMLIFYLVYIGRISHVKVASIGMLLATAIVVHGAYRESGTLSYNVDSATGIFSQEEAGMLILQGVHLVAMTEMNNIPSELQEGIIEKVLRPIPLVNELFGKRMLADRYMETFFHRQYQDGAGLAFGLVPELYAYGSFLAVIGFALTLGTLMAALLSRKLDLYLFSSYIYMVIHLLRSELSVFLASCLAVIIGFYVVQFLRGKLQRRIKAPLTY